MTSPETENGPREEPVAYQIARLPEAVLYLSRDGSPLKEFSYGTVTIDALPGGNRKAIADIASQVIPTDVNPSGIAGDDRFGHQVNVGIDPKSGRPTYITAVPPRSILPPQ